MSDSPEDESQPSPAAPSPDSLASARVVDREEAKRGPKPEPRPDALYVVSDGAGFIGAFPSAAAAEEAMLPHPLVPYIVQRFPAAPGPVDTVWVILFRDLDAVAFVSNDRGEAARIQQVYAGVGLAYPDDVDYWEQPFGVVSRPAAERLEIQTRAYRTWGAMTEDDFRAAEEADVARIEALCAPRADGPLARAFRENERITILDAVVPWAPSADTRGSEPLDYAGFAAAAGLEVGPAVLEAHRQWVEGSPSAENCGASGNSASQ